MFYKLIRFAANLKTSLLGIMDHGMIDDAAQTKGPVRVLLTGFGPFNGVPDNPTEKLVKIMQASDGRDLDARLSDGTITLACCKVLEVSVAAVDLFFESLEIEGEDDPLQPIILLHLGVQYDADSFRVERFAYNESHFRVPDQRGFQATAAKVCRDGELGCPAESRFPVESLVSELQACGHNVQASCDPGRFLCNYIYFRSLRRFKNVLFLHVPPEEHTDLNAQMEFLSDLLCTLAKLLRSDVI